MSTAFEVHYPGCGRSQGVAGQGLEGAAHGSTYESRMVDLLPMARVSENIAPPASPVPRSRS